MKARVVFKIHRENRKVRIGEVRQQGKNREQQLHKPQQGRGGFKDAVRLSLYMQREQGQYERRTE